MPPDHLATPSCHLPPLQVEERDNPSIRGIPAAVVQYKTWQGGGIIAVNYEARARGVTRQMRGAAARALCPEIALVQVPESRDKADLTKYRRAGREVIEVLVATGATVERASIDEAYLDLTALVEERMAGVEAVGEEELPNTHLGGGKAGEERRERLAGWLEEVAREGREGDLRLAVGAALVEEARREVYRCTGFRCSAGIAHCKTLAKLCAGQNKPNGQTVLPRCALAELYSSLPLTKVRGLGGKLGEALVAGLGVATMAALVALPRAAVEAATDPKTAAWLALLCQGQDGEEVKERELPKSIGCGKNFRGPDMLDTEGKVRRRLGALVEELVERVEADREEHGRVAGSVAVSVGQQGLGGLSRAGPLRGYSYDQVLGAVWGLVSRLNTTSSTLPSDSTPWTPAITNLAIGASKFQDADATTPTITSFFSKAPEGPVLQVGT